MVSAHDLAKRQRDISIAEFFEKNRHLLGFDNKRKSLLTSIKEAVDNSADAAEDASILPDIKVEINQLSNFKYSVMVEDNGPGIIKSQIPKVFAKLLYGSKFFKLSQSLTGDEPIMCRLNGKISIIPLGELVDKHLRKAGEAKVDNLEVPSFDWKKYRYSFSRASSVIKHKRQHDIFKISTTYGKSIKVTGCHSLFALNKDLVVKEVEANKIKKGDFIVAPKAVPYSGTLSKINILEYINYENTQNKWSYVYNVPKDVINKIVKNSEVVEKVLAKRKRKFFRLKDVSNKNLDILKESIYNYLRKSYLPLHVVLRLGLVKEVENCTISSYLHGKITKVPVTWQLTRSLMRFFGLYVAKGQCGSRQIGFSFRIRDEKFASEIRDIARDLGLNPTTELRPERNRLTVKIFSGFISCLMMHWCGKGASKKIIPEFIFECNKDLRQDFIDALHQGDGHDRKMYDQLVHSTISKNLALQLSYLWLMNGAVASFKLIEKKARKYTSKVYVTTVYRSDLNCSKLLKPKSKTRNNKYRFMPKNLFAGFLPENKRESLSVDLFKFLKAIHLGVSDKQILNHLELLQNTKQNKSYSKAELSNISLETTTTHSIQDLVKKGYLIETSSGFLISEKTQKLCHLVERLQLVGKSDICILEVTNVQRITEGHEYVYDISVPLKENFVASGLSCHNSRGQQGIGISAAVLYSQLTTGKPAKITSRISAKEPAHYYELHIDVKNNTPEILKEETVEWSSEHGTKIELTLEADYLKGPQSVDEYIRQTAIINPHITLIYTNPKAEQFIYNRAANHLPPHPREIKPHPYGIEIGLLMRMLNSSPSRTLQAFLMSEFSRVGSGTAKEICENAAVLPSIKPGEITRETAEKILDGIKKTKIIAPPTDCISPIGQDLLEKGLKKEVEAEFYCSTSRPASVYRGNPFAIEASIAYGGKQAADRQITLMRFANRVPLLYQQGACAITQALTDINWRSYGLQQSGNSIPTGPVIIVVHMASVWVPFTSEAKEAIAHYPEIIKELRLALQECGRKLGIYIHKKERVKDQLERANLFEHYIPEVAENLAYLTGADKDLLILKLRGMLKKDEIQAQLELDKPSQEEK